VTVSASPRGADVLGVIVIEARTVDAGCIERPGSHVGIGPEREALPRAVAPRLGFGDERELRVDEGEVRASEDLVDVPA
jgi:hypothetical protein